MAVNIEENFPDGARLSIVQFASEARVVFDFESGLTKQEMADTVRSLIKLGGATWSQSAFVEAYESVWTPVLDEFVTNFFFFSLFLSLFLTSILCLKKKIHTSV